MKSLITVLLLGLFISSQAQNISQSQVRQFNAVTPYRVFGRGAGVGTPSFITLDSNHVPQLHSQGYYDLRYGSLGIQNGKLNSNFGTQGSVLFRGTTGISQDNTNFFYDSTNSRLGIGTTSPATKIHVFSTNKTGGVAVDGSNSPAFSLRGNGIFKGSLSYTTLDRDYFFTSLVNDINLRAEKGGRVLIGVHDGTLAGVPPAIIADSINKVYLPSYKNNVAEDSVLSTDVNGKLKLKLASTSGGSSTTGYKTSDTVNIVRDYSADSTGVADATTAIQNAINYTASRGGGVIFFPKGTYNIAGMIKTTDGNGHAVDSAQLYVPFIAYSNIANMASIKLVGEVPPSPYNDWTAGQSNPVKGVVLKSTSTSLSGSVIGAAYGANTWGNWTFHELFMENITVKVRSKTSSGVDTAATMSALNASKISMLDLSNCRYVTESYQGTSAQPASGTYGIKGPANNNFNNTNYHNLMIQGFYTGLQASEHVDASNLSISTCYNGVEFTFGHHASLFAKLKIWWCVNNLYFTGAHQTQINQLDLEEFTNLAGTKWFNNAYDIYEPTNTGSNAAITYHRVVAMSGVNQTIVKSVISNIKATAIGGDFYSQGIGSSQSIAGGSSASGTLTVASTSSATKGKILFGTSAYDEANTRLGIGVASPSYPLQVTGNIGTPSYASAYFDNTNATANRVAINHASNAGLGMYIGGGLKWSVAAANMEGGTNSDFAVNNDATGILSMIIDGNTSNLGLNIAATEPTARLHLGAGTTAAKSAPLKFTSGVNLTTPEAGALEYDGTNFYATNSTANRYTLSRLLTTGGAANAGTVTLAAGTATISTTAVAAGSVIELSYQNCSSCGTLYKGAITAGTSFVINSTNAADASTISWRIIF